MPTTLDLYLRPVTLCATKRRSGILATLRRCGCFPPDGLTRGVLRPGVLTFHSARVLPGADATLEPVQALQGNPAPPVTDRGAWTKPSVRGSAAWRSR